tara:strand:- start:27904 stop:29379 length:1476 start_codon:yes stop_codon:yes gene_type:complete
MLPLARLALARGYSVWGSDAKLSREAVADLKKEGIYAAGPPSAGRIDEMEGGLVVYSTAISESHPERMRAHELHSRGKLRLLHRMDFLNELVAHAPLRLGMAGTHGKTSSTALAGWMLMELGKDPLIIAGGRPLYLDRSIRNGEKVAVFETDESDGSFLRSNATHRLILNADEDHLNYYGGFENLQQAFQEFASSGTVIYNTGDPGLIPLRNSSLPLEGYCIYPSRAECMQSDAFLAGYFPDQDDTLEFRIRRHHLKSASNDFDSAVPDPGAQNGPASNAIAESNPGITGQPTSEFEKSEEEVFYRFRLGVPGRHFASNALGILGLVLLAFDDLDIQKCIQALESFPGTERRLECLGTHKGMPVYDDYGHHPSEIRAVLDALTQRFPGREIRVVFQPHRYTRTRELASSFAASLAHAGRVFLLPLYSAGEEPLLGVDSALIGSFMPANKPAHLLDDDVSPVFESPKGNPIVLFLGAGDVSQTARKLFRQTV